MSWIYRFICLENFASTLENLYRRAPFRTASAALLAAVTSAASAQTAHYLATQTRLFSSSLTTAQGIAVDGNGNIYIANSGANVILKETLANGVYSESQIGTQLNFPEAIVLDSSGNIYVADKGNSRIALETYGGGTSYTESTVGSFGAPQGVAMDAQGNLYVGDTGNGQVVKGTVSGGHFAQTALVATGSAYTQVAVDGAGNVYISDPHSQQVLKEAPSGGGYTQTVVKTGVDGAAGLFVDGNNNLFIADKGTAGAGSIVEETPSGASFTETLVYKGAAGIYGIAEDQNKAIYFTSANSSGAFKLLRSGTDFGSLEVGSASSTALLIFLFDTSGSVAQASVVTQGVAKLDFADFVGGSCEGNGSPVPFASGDVCTVNVQFAPTQPGSRYGGVILTNTQGGVIATGYVHGSGVGSQVNFPPGQQSALPLSTLTSPTAVAADGMGNLYVAQAIAVNDPGNAVYKETWNGSGYTQTTVATGFANPVGVAVDGVGNVYVADENAPAVYKETLGKTGYTQSVIDNTLASPRSIAVDGSGNVYVGLGAGSVEKETLSAGAYTASQIYAGGAAVSGIAVDGSGNLVLAQNGTAPVLKLASGSLTQSSIGTLNAAAVAVDGMGNVYGANTASGTVWSEQPSNNSYLETVLSTGLNSPAGLAVDGAGNVYYSSAAAGTVWELDNADGPTLTFATTAYGSTSSDSPKFVTVANVGNDTMEIPPAGIGSNPSASAGWSIDDSAASACPVVSRQARNGQTLAAGATCELAISFSPAFGGPNTGSLVLYDNALNSTLQNYSKQTIPLSGAGTHGPAPIDWPNPAAVDYGTALSAAQFNATSAVAGSFSYSPAVGTLLSAGVHTLTATFTPVDQTTYITTQAMVPFTVARVSPAITWAAPAAIAYGTALGSAQLNATAPVAGTFSYSPAAGTLLAVGTQTLSVTFTPTDTTDYLTTTVTTSLVVGKATSTDTLASSSANVFVADPVTFTATVPAVGGIMPSGIVSFYDGTKLIGAALLNQGAATYTTSSLAAGTHSITAAYSGDANFAALTSAVLSEVVEDFTLGAASGGSTTATGSPGGTATFSLAMTPPTGQTFPAAVAFSVVGLPAGATATFSPASIAAGAGATNVTLTVQLANSAKASPAPELFGRGGMTVVLGLILFPFLTRRARKNWIAVVVGSAMLLGCLTGCTSNKNVATTGNSGGSGGGSGSGSGATTPINYTLLVTAKSGALGHTVNLTLTVE